MVTSLTVDLDLWALQRLNGLAGRWPLVDRAAVLTARFGSVAEVALVLTLPLVAGWRGLAGLSRAASALVLATGSVRLLQLSVPRMRPYMDQTVKQLVARRPGRTFPSRHVASAFALAVPAWRAHRPLGAVMLGLAMLMGASRVYSGLHYPSDVVVGAGVGIACGRLTERRRRR